MWRAPVLAVALVPIAGLAAWVAVSARRGAEWAEDVAFLAAALGMFGSPSITDGPAAEPPYVLDHLNKNSDS